MHMVWDDTVQQEGDKTVVLADGAGEYSQI